ncbi:hypothetical protein RFI_01231 [Reticulomyxa filosa]|uniref:Uncharacterized protein n=1 Tax=Reticulomyxa filosa TaxID=46433 RepID=X6PCD2_RETFI|nr:hypothetical protein RFI_01231 [Reticulomyxa filosa]|eukprot:ETO35831.1 hypothetical protein RFI_01231 [Reticulomyxa filosa]
METQIENYTDNVDFYNVLQFDLNLSQSLSVDTYVNDYLFVQRKHFLHDIDRYLHKRHEYAETDPQMLSSGVNETQLNYIMNGPIKQQLSLVVPQSVVWGGQSNDVFAAQEEDFMKPVVNEVDMLLQKGLHVNVWNGQLDLICCTLGTLDWIESLSWGSLPNWQKVSFFFFLSAKNAQLNLDQTDVAYFKKSYNNFAMYFMMKAGHMVPADNPVAAFQALSDIVGLPL